MTLDKIYIWKPIEIPRRHNLKYAKRKQYYINARVMDIEIDKEIDI